MRCAVIIAALLCATAAQAQMFLSPELNRRQAEQERIDMQRKQLDVQEQILREQRQQTNILRELEQQRRLPLRVGK